MPPENHLSITFARLNNLVLEDMLLVPRAEPFARSPRRRLVFADDYGIDVLPWQEGLRAMGL
jgi:hypothetical protein